MQPPNKGRRIQIRVNGRQRTGYYDEQGANVGWFYMDRWFEFPAESVQRARDAMRNYFSTLDALHEGKSPECIQGSRTTSNPTTPQTSPGTDSTPFSIEWKS